MGWPNPATRQVFAERTRAARGPRDGARTATCTTPTSAAGRSSDSARSTPIQAPTAGVHPPRRTNGAAPLHVSFDATGSTDPNGDALLYAWDLDGDGAYDDSTAHSAELRPTTRPARYTARLRVSDPGRSQRHGLRDDHRGRGADRDDRHAGGEHPVERGRGDRLLGLGGDQPGQPGAGERPCLEACAQPLLGAESDELPPSTSCRPLRARRARSRRRITTTLPTSSFSSPPPTAACRAPSPGDSIPGRWT